MKKKKKSIFPARTVMVTVSSKWHPHPPAPLDTTLSATLFK